VLSKELLKILACPLCKSPVIETGDSLLCTDASCRRRYRIDDGIPVMLIDEATVVEPTEFEKILAEKK
jgi:hypothetical protein